MSDERILGGDEFVREVLGEAEGRMDVVVPKHEQLQQFSEAIEQACKSADISIAFLRSGSKGDVLPKLRKELAGKGVHELGLSMAETARQLGVTTNALTEFIRKSEKLMTAEEHNQDYFRHFIVYCIIFRQ